MSRKIIHIDMDCFYAAVEMRDFPEYRNKPIAVGGDGPRSVLSTCNYEARQFGVRSAMPAIKAKQLCPNLLIVPGRMQVYREVSQQVRAIFEKYTDKIEPLSLDEAYLDVTDAKHCNGSATLIAEQIRKEIFETTQLTASAGVAPNKFIAKIASDENKPNGICVVSPEKVNEFVENLSLRKIPGIGPKTYERLERVGLTTCADVRNSSIKELLPVVGSWAPSLYQKAYGVDDREVITERIRKSLGVERTLMDDLTSAQQCIDLLDNLLEKLNERFAKVEDKNIAKLGVKLKFADFNQTTVEQQGSAIEKQVFAHLLEKAFQRSEGRGVRLVGISLGFKQAEENQQNQLDLPL